jgi:hypothetical protein
VRGKYGFSEFATYCRILRGSDSTKICAFKDANNLDMLVTWAFFVF